MINYYPGAPAVGRMNSPLFALLRYDGPLWGWVMGQQNEFEPTQSRPDGSLAGIVETGISMQKTHGRDYAAAYLRKHGVSLKVMARVLSEPQRRRGAPPAPEAPFFYLR